MNDEANVKRAHEQFYAALTRLCFGDPAPMTDVWVHDDSVTTSHPLGPWVLGWAEIEATWHELAKAISSGEGDIASLQVRVLGDVAYTTCTENWTITMLGKTLSFSSNATNIYRRTADGWKIIHHHADKAPSFEAAV